ncbi:MAG: DotA/TraY family protein [Alphaproteobacteria bacterium]|nr:DotA/TraY family protein [Alphaproteobacteria bacterium]
MAVQKGQVAGVIKYTLLPQVLPRAVDLLFSGFHYFAFFIAQVYGGVRLLPPHHPYLNARNIGHFSILDVVFTTHRHLQYRKTHTDQIIIYYLILVALLVMLIQIMSLLMGLIMPSAMAMSLSYFFGESWETLLSGYNGNQDLAFILLDRVFGVPGIFDSCVAKGGPCFRSTGTLMFSADTVYTPIVFPWPFHHALHALYQFYSTGLLVIAMFIILYFVVVIVAETAQTGVPFGKRFNGVWAPLRLVIAIGLLVPIGYGLNTAQYIVLYAAKFGSNFGTNGWMVFNKELKTGHMFEGMIAKPQKPEISGLLKFMMMAHACKAVEEGYMSQGVSPPVKTNECGQAITDDDEQKVIIEAYLVKNGVAGFNALPLEVTNYNQAMTFFGNTDMTIRFGDRGCTESHVKELGNVVPTCGELVLPQAALKDPGALAIQGGYYDLVKHLWGNYTGRSWSSKGFCDAAQVNTVLGTGGNQDFKKRSIYYVQGLCDPNNVALAGATVVPTADWVNSMQSGYVDGDVCNAPSFNGISLNLVAAPTIVSGITASVILENIIRKGVYVEIHFIGGAGSTNFMMTMDEISRGWAGAGMWYNHIAGINGAVSGAAWKVPQISKMTQIQLDVIKQNSLNTQHPSPGTITAPVAAGDRPTSLPRGDQEAKAAAQLHKIDELWESSSLSLKPKSGNAIYDFLNYLFGTKGLFDLKDPVNQGTHPLALMTALGKGLIEASIRNLGLGLGAQLFSIVPVDIVGPLAEGASSLFYTAATITLTAGFILYYILPFLPFVYFFFAVGNWVKGIFEALVGVPLWALAHIRIDGEGLPGSAALNGYFLIFEIFLRPILIVFGLIAAVSIFGAMALVMNSIFDLAVYNVGGVDLSPVACGLPAADTNDLMDMVRGPVDQFFYTVMYCVIIYIMALSSFKLIDLIPNKILRWMGANVDTFGDLAGDPAQSLTQYAAIGGNQVTQGLVSSMKSSVGALGKVAQGTMKAGQDGG